MRGPAGIDGTLAGQREEPDHFRENDGAGPAICGAEVSLAGHENSGRHIPGRPAAMLGRVDGKESRPGNHRAGKPAGRTPPRHDSNPPLWKQSIERVFEMYRASRWLRL